MFKKELPLKSKRRSCKILGLSMVLCSCRSSSDLILLKDGKPGRTGTHMGGKSNKLLILTVFTAIAF